MKPTLQQTLDVMRDIDQKLHAKEEASSAIEWAKEIKETYKNQGVDVSESLIQEAIVNVVEKKFTPKSPHGLAKLLAPVVVHENKILGIASALLVAIMVSTGISSLMSFMAGQRMKALQEEVALINVFAEKNQKMVPAAPQVLTAQIKADLEGLVVLTDIAPQNEDVGERLLADAKQRQKKVNDLLKIAREMNAFDGWIKTARPLTLDWTAQGANVALDKRQSAISAGNWAAVANSQELVRNLYSGDALYPQSEKALAAWPASYQKKANDLLQKEKNAWISGSGPRVHESIINENNFFVTPLDLIIVSRSDVRSGVWRTIKGTGIKNYYIVMEAIDPNGKAMTVNIQSEETQKWTGVNIFAVRVDESVYEKVKNDKTDDGIINNKTFGTKPANSFEYSFNMPTTGKMITEW